MTVENQVIGDFLFSDAFFRTGPFFETVNADGNIVDIQPHIGIYL